MSIIPDDMKEIVKDFLVESQESLDTIDQDLLFLEANPNDTVKIGSIFRGIHSIKGACGFLGFSKLEKVSHSGENVLSKLRDGLLPLNGTVLQALLEMVDAVRRILSELELKEDEGNEDFSNLVSALASITASAKSKEEQAEANKKLTENDWKSVAPKENLNEIKKPEKHLGEILVDSGNLEPMELVNALKEQLDGDPRRVGEILLEQGSVKFDHITTALENQKNQSTKTSALSEQNIRVDVELLTKLMNQMGELVLSRNQLLQIAVGMQDPILNAATQKLNRITSELQEGLMMTRMQPVSSQWGRFPRMIRDLASACGKKVRLEMSGQETELDKTLLEAIKDPLTHILRNSVDHGVENPTDRIASGKPEEGFIHLKAFQERGMVVIKITDDGKGLNPEKIKSKAIEKGLITAIAAETMSEQSLVELIFLPGFSTAEKVTNVSGRGVGMDVVRTNIEKVSGTVSMLSNFGKGTELTIRIPLTLAIIPALMVKVGGKIFATPQSALVELIRLTPDVRKKSLENLNGSYLYKYRLGLLQIFKLSQILEIEESIQSESEATWFILVLQLDGKQFGLVVDSVLDTQEIVVKALAKRLKDLMVYSGATILGNGEIALILDIGGVASKVELTRTDEISKSSLDSDDGLKKKSVSEQYVVFKTRDESRFAVPLRPVRRLENLQNPTLERSGKWVVIQHAGEIIPMVFLDLWNTKELPTNQELERYSENVEFILFQIKHRTIALVVNKIQDIVEETPSQKTDAGRDGVYWAAVLAGHITEFPDLERFIKIRDENFFDREISNMMELAL